MKSFVEKYADSFDAKDALKLMKSKLEMAIELCRDKKKDEYIKHLATLHEMVEDYFTIKGISLDSVDRE